MPTRLEEYYHDGSKHTNRKIEKEQKKLVNKLKQSVSHLDRLQEQWLNIDNPFLWDGEIDVPD